MKKIFLIATEESGDRLGSALMKVLRQRLGDDIQFEGVGGSTMAREGLVSLFPIEDLSIIGFAAVVQRLPMILRRIAETTDAVLKAAPDILVIIDSPDFTHRVARRVRRRNPAIPIVNYVSPSVWAWRPGRARAMKGYVDHVLALLPFEPEAHRSLGGPPCTYVGRRAAMRSRRCCWCCPAAGAARSATTWRSSVPRLGCCRNRVRHST
jgi:lipid-A-disaccharide synthase